MTVSTDGLVLWWDIRKLSEAVESMPLRWVAEAAAVAAACCMSKRLLAHAASKSGGTLNTWRSGDDGRPVTERLQARF
jgi:hypothetical protein